MSGGASSLRAEDIRAVEKAWPVYFGPEDAFVPDDIRVDLVKELVAFFLSPKGQVLLRDVDLVSARVVPLHYGTFIEQCDAMSDLDEAIRSEPGEMIPLLRVAVTALQLRLLPVDAVAQEVFVRLHSVTPLTPLGEIRADLISQFVSVRGSVLRVSAVRPLVVQMSFRCLSCLGEMQVEFEEGKYEPPSRCLATPRCRSRKFDALRETARTVDWQKVRIQETAADALSPGRVPRTVEVELAHDLVDGCVPGDVVCVAGTIKTVNVEVQRGRGTANARNLFVLYVDAHSLTTAKVGRGGLPNASVFSARELAGIRSIATSTDPFALLLASCCPAIFGNHIIKAGLLLGLFGGTGLGDDPAALANASATTLHIRPDPHVLVVGDPGLGKSQMLRTISTLAPRGVYVTGNTASSTGLTVTMVRDPVTGDASLEAGALVLSDQGVCCIDEFDKMGKEHEALLEAMEQQRISIAKGGMVCSLAARATVLAAANPRGGHYDRSRTVGENLRLAPALLSRFDLVFILVDKADDERDKQLSAHIMSLHRGHGREVAEEASGVGGPGDGLLGLSRDGRRRGGVGEEEEGEEEGEEVGGVVATPRDVRERSRQIAVADARIASQQPVPRFGVADAGASSVLLGGDDAGIVGGGGGSGGLEQRLREAAGRVEHQVVPEVLLRKYVAYARRFCHPVLSPGAAAVLRSFYLSLRKKHVSGGSTPITTRQLEAMVRLTQARAKTELRNVANSSDAQFVVDLLRLTIVEAAMDEGGLLDLGRTATGMSLGKQVKVLVAALQKAAAQRRSAAFSRDEIAEVAARVNILATSLPDLIEVLNQQSYLLKRGPRQYKLLTSAFDE